MTSLTRYSTALTTGSDDIPLATSSSPQLRPSHRVNPRPGRLSSPRPRQPRPDARRNRSNTLTTAATTPVRGPPIIDKGKGVDRGPRATSVDPNLAPFRYPSYTAVDLDVEERTPFSQMSSPSRRSVSEDIDEEEEDDSGSESDHILPYHNRNHFVYDYPPRNAEDSNWLKEMYQTVGPDDRLKDQLASAKQAIAQRLYESTAATLQVNELYQEHIAMLADIGRRAGEDVVRSICKEAKVPFEQLFNTEGGANGRHVPAPAPRPQRNANPAARARGAQQTCAFGVKLPAVATMLRTAPSAAPVIPTAPVAGVVRTASMVAEPPSDAETEPVDRTSPAPSSPTHKASTRAQKRRRDALTRDPTLQLDFMPVKKPRFGRFASTFTNAARSSSPLPPSSPVRTERSSSVRMSSRSPPPLPPLPALSSVPRPPPPPVLRSLRSLRMASTAYLEPASDVPIASESDLGKDDDDWRMNDSNAENIDVDGHAVNLSQAPAALGGSQGEEADTDMDMDKETETGEGGEVAAVSVRRPLVNVIDPEGGFTYYAPEHIRPPSSQMDWSMAWSDKDEEQKKDKDEFEDESDDSAVAVVGDAEGAQGHADSSFGDSVSVAIKRNKRIAAQLAVSPGAGARLGERPYVRGEREPQWKFDSRIPIS